MNYILSVLGKLSKIYDNRAWLRFRPVVFLGLMGLLTLSSNAMDDPREGIEKQRNSHSYSSDVSLSSEESTSEKDTIEKQRSSHSHSVVIPLEEDTVSDQGDKEKDKSSQNSVCYENIAFSCGKMASCYYWDDMGFQNDSTGKSVRIPISNHECHPCVRCTCIWGTLTVSIVTSALLLGGATSYAPDCASCCFPRVYGAYTDCTPDCRLPFMSTVGAIDLASVLPACTTYSCYGCAGCNNKKEFQKKFKEGQSCLPEHRFSFRNFYSLITSNPLVNFCWGPTEDNSHKS